MSSPLRHSPPPHKLSAKQYQRLTSEAATPYKGLRLFLYLAVAASGAIGGLVFVAQLMAGRDVATALPNLALQVGVVALVMGLWRWEKRRDRGHSDRS